MATAIINSSMRILDPFLSIGFGIFHNLDESDGLRTPIQIHVTTGLEKVPSVRFPVKVNDDTFCVVILSFACCGHDKCRFGRRCMRR